MRIICVAGVAILGLLMTQAPNLDNLHQVDGTICGMEGKVKADAPDAEHHKALNRAKNRYDIPSEVDIDPDVTLAAMMAPGDDLERFDPHKAARIQGWVVNVLVGGVESRNCRAEAHIDRDTHIEMGLTPDAGETERVIVEVTPRLRLLMQEQGINWWTTEALGKAHTLSRENGSRLLAGFSSTNNTLRKRPIPILRATRSTFGATPAGKCTPLP